jgi:hypothetical protein
MAPPTIVSSASFAASDKSKKRRASSKKTPPKKQQRVVPIDIEHDTGKNKKGAIALKTLSTTICASSGTAQIVSADGSSFCVNMSKAPLNIPSHATNVTASLIQTLIPNTFSGKSNVAEQLVTASTSATATLVTNDANLNASTRLEEYRLNITDILATSVIFEANSASNDKVVIDNGNVINWTSKDSTATFTTGSYILEQAPIYTTDNGASSIFLPGGTYLDITGSDNPVADKFKSSNWTITLVWRPSKENDNLYKALFTIYTSSTALDNAGLLTPSDGVCYGMYTSGSSIGNTYGQIIRYPVNTISMSSVELPFQISEPSVGSGNFWRVLTLSLSGGILSLYHDGVCILQETQLGTTLTDVQRIRIGAPNSDGIERDWNRFQSMFITECHVSSHENVSDLDFEGIHAYFLHKYRHPTLSMYRCNTDVINIDVLDTTPIVIIGNTDLTNATPSAVSTSLLDEQHQLMCFSGPQNTTTLYPSATRLSASRDGTTENATTNNLLKRSIFSYVSSNSGNNTFGVCPPLLLANYTAEFSILSTNPESSWDATIPDSQFFRAARWFQTADIYNRFGSLNLRPLTVCICLGRIEISGNSDVATTFVNKMISLIEQTFIQFNPARILIFLPCALPKTNAGIDLKANTLTYATNIQTQMEAALASLYPGDERVQIAWKPIDPSYPYINYATSPPTLSNRLYFEPSVSLPTYTSLGMEQLINGKSVREHMLSFLPSYSSTADEHFQYSGGIGRLLVQCDTDSDILHGNVNPILPNYWNRIRIYPPYEENFLLLNEFTALVTTRINEFMSINYSISNFLTLTFKATSDSTADMTFIYTVNNASSWPPDTTFYFDYNQWVPPSELFKFIGKYTDSSDLIHAVSMNTSSFQQKIVSVTTDDFSTLDEHGTFQIPTTLSADTISQVIDDGIASTIELYELGSLTTTINSTTGILRFTNSSDNTISLDFSAVRDIASVLGIESPYFIIIPPNSYTNGDTSNTLDISITEITPIFIETNFTQGGMNLQSDKSQMLAMIIQDTSYGENIVDRPNPPIRVPCTAAIKGNNPLQLEFRLLDSNRAPVSVSKPWYVQVLFEWEQQQDIQELRSSSLETQYY